MKSKELRALTGEELAGQLAAAREELFKLRMQAATGQLEKPVQLRAARREIARILGIMNESKQEERK